VISALYGEMEDKETLRSLLLALGMLLFAGEEGGGAEGLCEAMELRTALREKRSLAALKGEGLLREVGNMLKGSNEV
jgi:hypothetical protein